MKSDFLKRLLAPALLLLHLSAFAEDIDLFVGLTPTESANLPNVLFLLDNAANFEASATHGCTYKNDGVAPSLGNSTGGMEQCALYNAIYDLEVNKDGTGKMRIGLMAYNANKFVDWKGNKCDAVTSVGGCLMVPLTEMTAANKVLILAWIRTWGTTFAIKTNNKANGAMMQEAWAYFAGRTGISGRSYKDIQPSAECLKNYVVFIGNAYNSSGTPADQSGDKGPKDALEGKNSVADKNAFPVATAAQKSIYLGPVTTMCGTYTFPTSHELGGYYADEWARYMASEGTINALTYTIGVHSDACKAEYAALLSSMATLGGGKYFPTTNFTELKVALESILSEVQPVNSAFASVSLPVSVNTQGTYLNQVFIGMFRPDEDALPRWMGNLKQYKMGMLGDQLALLDGDGLNALDTNLEGTGFFAPCARSYWTPDADDAYWTNIPAENANCVGHPAASNTPDGNIVEKGGQGYSSRAMTPSLRNVLTCTGTCSALANFDTANAAITKTLLGDAAMSDDQRTNLINWARGLNNKGDEFGAATIMRPSVHGDVVHSRPVAINFGTDDAPQVVVFYGSNDGTLRAINGNRPDKATPDIGAAAPGTELWSFVAPETYGKLDRLRENLPKIKFAGAATGEPKPYGMDGPIVGYKDEQGTEATSDDKFYIFASMRRGGNALYGFDVTAPASPVVKWRFTTAGQSWSSPRILKTSGYDSGNTPMLILGGGYDTCEDADPNVCSAPAGNRVYVLNALTGAKLAEFTTLRSVIAEVFVVPDAVTGLAKYAYAADLGGNIYRISGADANTPFESTAPGSWTMTRIASLGCDVPDSCTANRKFMFAPDILDDNGTYVLLIGSGDREKPLTVWTSATGVKNHFFMLRDRPTETTWLTEENGTCGMDLICRDSLLAIGSDDPSPEDLASKPKGWYLEMRDTEQIVTAALTIYDVVTFHTHMPADPASASLCKANLGETSVYNVYYSNAASANGTDERYEDVAGDGLPPSPVGGIVKLDDGTSVPFVIGKSPITFDPDIPELPGSTKQPKTRVFWYIDQ